MANQIQAVIKSLRPTHWVKNLSLFAALIFSGNLFNQDQLIITVWAASSFSLAASSVYLFNDVLDREQDKLHPVKKKRPIAQGLISPQDALFLSTMLVVISLFLASYLSFFFLSAIILYVILQISYTLLFKKVPVLDILAIAAGFILRVWSGAFVINVHLSVWFLLCVISVSLFLAAGKRRAELGILTQFGKTRQLAYQPVLLDSFLTMFGTAAWLSWALFTFFQVSPEIELLPISSQLPLTLAGIGKWLMLTIPIVIFGIMRYLHITYTTTLAETPERTLIRDKPLLSSVLIWGALVVLILYS